MDLPPMQDHCVREHFRMATGNVAYRRLSPYDAVAHSGVERLDRQGTVK